MALTKIGSIGINTGIQFAGVTTIATLNGSDAVLSVGGTVNFVSDVSIGGTVSIAGTLTYEDVTNIDAVGLITARNGIVVGSGITLSKDGDIFATGVTTSTTFSGNLSGGTVSGTTGTFTGDVGIGIANPDAYQSSSRNLVIGKASDAAGMTIRTGTSNGGYIRFADGTSGNQAYRGTVAYVHDGDYMTFATDSTERLRITSSGDVGIGTNIPGGDLHIYDDDSSSRIYLTSGNSDDSSIYFGRINDTATAAIRNDHSDNSFRFYGYNNAERLRIESAGTVKVSKNLSVTGIATVGSAVTLSESGIEASGIGITCANINGGKIGGRRNLIINGAMVINQRNSSTTSDNGYGCDRWRQHFGNTDESPTLSQADVASGTEPYNIGLRKCLRLTNGNQTSGAGQFDYSWMRYRGEAQDIVTSGWNYTSSTSFLTLSFYIKSSVAQNFYGYFKDVDGSPDRAFPFETGSLSANTWKRVAVVIPGDSGLTFDNNSGRGFEIFWGAFVGTYYSSNSSSVGTWKNYTDNDRVPDSTTTWYTTNDATLEITGVQLELGTEATPFEHRTFADDYRDCLRYYYESRADGNNFTGNGPNNYASGYFGFGLNGDRISASVRFPVPMRDIPTVTMIRPSDGSAGKAHIFRGVTGSNGGTDVDFGSVSAIDIGNFGFLYWSCGGSTVTQGGGYLFHIKADAEI